MDAITSVILFVITSILALIFHSNKHTMESKRIKSGLKYYFLSNSLDFLLPFIFVLTFYILLLLIVSSSINSEVTSLYRLIWMEEKLLIINSWVSWLKLSAAGIVIGFAVLYLIGLLRIPFEKQLSKGYDLFLKMSKRVYIVLVLLCSFTLLGSHSGKLCTNLQVRVKTIRQGYSDVCEQAKSVLSEEVAAKLYDKVRNSFPPDYIKALELSAKIDGEVASFRNFYQEAHTKYGIKNERAESLITGALSRKESGSGLQGEYEVRYDARGETEKTEFIEAYPEWISYQKIQQAKLAFEKYQQKEESKVITFFTTESGKKLAMKLPKILTSKLKSQIFSSLIESRPIIGLMIDCFFDTIDDAVGEQVGKAVYPTVRVALENPDSAPKTIEEESSKIASGKDVKMSPQILEKAYESRRQLDKQRADFEETRSLVENQVREERVRVENEEREERIRLENETRKAGQKKIDSLIAELSSPNEHVREHASGELSNMGDVISRSQVKRLEDIMRKGSKTWSKFLYRESHCRWFENTSIKYYAANALQGMNSPYVDHAMATEANNLKNKNKTRERVTDPGWI